jgi:hypothetical protein
MHNALNLLPASHSTKPRLQMYFSIARTCIDIEFAFARYLIKPLDFNPGLYYASAASKHGISCESAGPTSETPL